MKVAGYTTLFSLLSVLLFNSCKNDLDLNAPYKEIPSVYAILNPQERIQMIRINKVFLGERNANEMAQVADSINYPAGELTVTLSRFLNGVQVNVVAGKQTITFRDSMIYNVSPGSFNTSQRVYVCSDDLHQGVKTTTTGANSYSVSGDYVLTIKNNRTGNIFTAKAAGIDSVGSKGSPLVNVLGPVYYPAPPLTTVNSVNFVDYGNQTTSYNVYYTPTPTGKVYQMIQRYYFSDPNGNIDFVDYTFANQYSRDVATTGVFAGMLKANFRGMDVFSGVGVAMSRKNVDLSVNRKMFKMQFFIYSSSNEYMDYLQYVSPSLSISQNKPLYSNFSNGALGLFTFRSRCLVTKEMAATFVDEFAYNPNTCSYRFRRYNDSEPGCN